MMDNFNTTADVALAQAQATAGGMKLHSAKTAPLDVIDKKSKEFEGVFMSQMLQPMFEGLKVDPIFGGGHGEEVMRSFLVQEYGKAMSANSHLGIANAVKNAMIKSQEAALAKNQPNPSLGAAYATLQ